MHDPIKPKFIPLSDEDLRFILSQGAKGMVFVALILFDLEDMKFNETCMELFDNSQQADVFQASCGLYYMSGQN